jgi:hypothetical protein
VSDRAIAVHNRGMAYWERAPDPRLARFVERVAFSSDPAGAPSPPIRVIPDGRIDLLVSVDDRGEGRADVFGVKTSALFASSERPVTNVALSFRPGGAAGLLGVRADELTDRVLAADELFGAGFSAPLLEATDSRTRSERLEAALLAGFRRGRAADLARAAARAETAGRCGRLSRPRRGRRAAAQRASARRWAPKTFARIARLRGLSRARARRSAGESRSRRLLTATWCTTSWPSRETARRIFEAGASERHSLWMKKLSAASGPGLPPRAGASAQTRALRAQFRPAARPCSKRSPRTRTPTVATARARAGRLPASSTISGLDVCAGSAASTSRRCRALDWVVAAYD